MARAFGPARTLARAARAPKPGGGRRRRKLFTHQVVRSNEYAETHDEWSFGSDVWARGMRGRAARGEQGGTEEGGAGAVRGGGRIPTLRAGGGRWTMARRGAFQRALTSCVCLMCVRCCFGVFSLGVVGCGCVGVESRGGETKQARFNQAAGGLAGARARALRRLPACPSPLLPPSICSKPSQTLTTHN